MKKVVIDIETVATAELKDVGSLNYAMHENTHISVICWKDTKEDTVHTLVHPRLATTPNKKEAILNFVNILQEDVKWIAHNAPFEKHILNNCLEKFLEDCGVIVEGGIDKWKLEDFIDTMTVAQMYGSPAALKKALKYFNLFELKDEKGHKTMKACTKMKRDYKEAKSTAAKTPCNWIEFKPNVYAKAGVELYNIMADYCAQDVIATDGLFAHLNCPEMKKQWGGFKKHHVGGMKMTNKMNEVGIRVDVEAARKLVKYADYIMDALDESTLKHFGVDGGNKKAKILEAINKNWNKPNDKMLKKVRETEYPEMSYSERDTRAIKTWTENNKLKNINYLDSLSPENIKEYLKTCEDDNIRQGLEDRLKYNKTSLAKITKILKTSTDGRLYDLMKYCGANATGRWSSFGVQLQNLPRPTATFEEVEELINGEDKTREEILENPDLVVSAIRALFLPNEDQKFFVADFDQVELRWSLWRCGYKNVVEEQIRGKDLYIDMAESIFNKKVGKDDEERQLGKMLMLAAQYGVGAGGFVANIRKVSDIQVSESDAKRYVQEFRKKYRKISDAWSMYGDMINKCLKSGEELEVKLVTGRKLNFGKIVERTFKDKVTGEKKTAIYHFDGTMHKKIYGSKVFQNVIQAECRDIMLLKANAMSAIGYDISMLVHDEVVISVASDTGLNSLNMLWNEVATESINKYFKGMPVSSSGEFKTKYYK